MPVRIFFRGLVLFRFPTVGDDADKLVAQLISAPQPGGGTASPGPHHHRPTIQIVTGEGPVTPKSLGEHEQITITAGPPERVRKSRSFEQHVPKLWEVAAKSTNPDLRHVERKNLKPDDSYVWCTVTVNRGTIRVKDVVIWDEGGFPLIGPNGPIGEVPSSPARLKFMGCDVQGHMANECVVEIPGDAVEIVSKNKDPHIERSPKSVRRDNPHTSRDTVEILVKNYEFQRVKPVWWGLDYQWLFKAAGYSDVDLTQPTSVEYDHFSELAKRYDSVLLEEDLLTLLQDRPRGLPFPYLMDNPLTPLRPLTEVDSRPVCVPGEA